MKSVGHGGRGIKMNCPKCKHVKTNVVGTAVNRRQRICMKCKHKFMTIETLINPDKMRTRISALNEAVKDLKYIINKLEESDKDA